MSLGRSRSLCYPRVVAPSMGTGRFDGTDGYTVEFTLFDGGEPGTSDTIKIKIFETANPTNVVLDLPTTFLAGGNLQAHFDQPHK